MNYEDDTFYIDFYINGVLKVNSADKKEKIEKLQKLLNDIVEDEALDLLKSESSLAVMSEAELLQTLANYPDSGDFN